MSPMLAAVLKQKLQSEDTQSIELVYLFLSSIQSKVHSCITKIASMSTSYIQHQYHVKFLFCMSSVLDGMSRWLYALSCKADFPLYISSCAATIRKTQNPSSCNKDIRIQTVLTWMWEIEINMPSWNNYFSIGIARYYFVNISSNVRYLFVYFECVQKIIPFLYSNH